MKAISLSLVAAAAAVFGCSCNATKSSLADTPSRAYGASIPAVRGGGGAVLQQRRPVVATSAKVGRRQMTVRTTAYSCKEKEKGGIYGSRNACGTNLRYGAVRSAAADWSRFPMGTKFRMVGQPQLYVVDDYGSALVGTNTIDIYKPTLGLMKDWGVRHIDIEVLEWGSLERSAEILKARTHVAHTRMMYNVINAKLSGIAARAGAASVAAVKRS